MRMPDFRAYAEEPSPQASFGQHNIGCNKPGATSLKRTLELSSLLGKWGGNGTALKWESVLSPGTFMPFNSITRLTLQNKIE